jgi:hypothetical protein
MLLTMMSVCQVPVKTGIFSMQEYPLFVSATSTIFLLNRPLELKSAPIPTGQKTYILVETLFWNPGLQQEILSIVNVQT